MNAVPTEVTVSDHAMLRYLERVVGIDMGDVRRRILTPDIVQAISHFHAGRFPHSDGFTLRVRENRVTTIIADDAETES